MCIYIYIYRERDIDIERDIDMLCSRCQVDACSHSLGDPMATA